MARDEAAAIEVIVQGEAEIQRTAILDEADRNWLLVLLDDNPREAEQRLKALYRQLETFFNIKRGSDAGELAQRTISRAVAKLKAGTSLTSAFGAFCRGMADMILHEDRKEQERRRKEMVLDDLSPDHVPVSEIDIFKQIYHSEALDCLRRCLKLLPATSHDLVLRYYEEDLGAVRIESRKALAAVLGISTEALTSRALRIREKLEDCVRPCLGEK